VNYDLLNGDVFLDNFKSTAASADFNLDGDVDGGDFLIWQRGFGIAGTATFAQGDADGNQTVNAADLAIWKQAFGSGAAVAAVGVVPEPSSCMLGLLSWSGLYVSMRRRYLLAQD
jgi:hypothetical protein